jgi:hypothetical protein
MQSAYKPDWDGLKKVLEDWRDTIDDPNAIKTEINMQRSNQQNASLYKWERELAKTLNDGGIPFGDVVIKLPREFTQENIHALVIHPLLMALYPDKTSTSQLSTTEIQDIYLRADKVISERTGVSIEWPSLESMSEEQR